MELKLSTQVPIQFEKQEASEDSRFTKVKIFLMHTGKNLNNSIFNKHVVEDALPSLANIPIVGYITTDKVNEADFNGHEQRMVIDKDGVKFEYLGRVYGIIPETNNAKFEMITVNGVEKEFLTCEGLLYNKFPEAVDIFERDGQKAQSMELESGSIEGKFNKNGVYEFSKFKFEAACILGENVTPAMTGSFIEKFSMSSMQEQMAEIMTEFNKSFTNFNSEISKEGGENVDKKLEMLEQFSQLGEEVLEQLKKSLESYSVEDLEMKLLQMSEAEARVEEQPEETFEEVVETTSEEVVEEIVQEDVVAEEVVEEFDFKSEYEKVKSELDSLSENFTKIQEELTTLREFKASKDKEEKLSVIEKFSELPEDVVKPFIEEVDKYSKDELELNLLAEVGKLNLSFSKKSVKKNGNDPIVSLTNFETTKTDVPSWFSLVEEYKQSKN